MKHLCLIRLIHPLLSPHDTHSICGHPQWLQWRRKISLECSPERLEPSLRDHVPYILCQPSWEHLLRGFISFHIQILFSTALVPSPALERSPTPAPGKHNPLPLRGLSSRLRYIPPCPQQIHFLTTIHVPLLHVTPLVSYPGPYSARKWACSPPYLTGFSFI